LKSIHISVKVQKNFSLSYNLWWSKWTGFSYLFPMLMKAENPSFVIDVNLWEIISTPTKRGYTTPFPPPFFRPKNLFLETPKTKYQTIVFFRSLTKKIKQNFFWQNLSQNLFVLLLVSKFLYFLTLLLFVLFTYLFCH
jgi:hypothetical protein